MLRQKAVADLAAAVRFLWQARVCAGCARLAFHRMSFPGPEQMSYARARVPVGCVALTCGPASQLLPHRTRGELVDFYYGVWKTRAHPRARAWYRRLALVRTPGFNIGRVG